LFDALERGFCSVEADVWLVRGQLLVAHDLENASPGRTLQSLYLDPLRERVAQNAGRVFRGGPTVTLLVAVKSGATNTYPALRKVLREYEPMLTRFRTDQTETNAVTVIISGNRSRSLMEGDSMRLSAFDGRLADLGSQVSPHFMPWISDNWAQHFNWK